jgi:isopentenyldiphosphate isomerase
MINARELLYIVDENNKQLQPQLRSVAHKTELWHRTTGIWVVNNKKQILCQKRSMKKDIKPGYWEAFFGGHIAPGKNYLESAVQECNEELGLTITKDIIIPYKIFKGDKQSHKEFQQVFALIMNKEIHEFQIEKEEIDEITWISMSNVKKILLDHRVTKWVQKPWDKEVLEWLETIIH